jgi:hypothetical protein
MERASRVAAKGFGDSTSVAADAVDFEVVEVDCSQAASATV